MFPNVSHRCSQPYSACSKASGQCLVLEYLEWHEFFVVIKCLQSYPPIKPRGCHCASWVSGKASSRWGIFTSHREQHGTVNCQWNKMKPTANICNVFFCFNWPRNCLRAHCRSHSSNPWTGWSTNTPLLRTKSIQRSPRELWWYWFIIFCMFVSAYLDVRIYTYMHAYITLHCITLHCITLHYIALH